MKRTRGTVELITPIAEVATANFRCPCMSNRHFEAYLSSGPPLAFSAFRQEVDAITHRFQALSTEALALRAVFETHEHEELTELLNRLQTLEATKLKKVRQRLDHVKQGHGYTEGKLP